MITRTSAYLVNNLTFTTLEEAQVQAICDLAPELQNAATIIVKEREKILDILTTGPRSKPRSRKINGAKRNKVPKEVAA